MFARFYPTDRQAGYRGSPHKERIDRIAQRLVEQRYLPVVVAQHLREWLRFSAYRRASWRFRWGAEGLTCRRT